MVDLIGRQWFWDNLHCTIQVLVFLHAGATYASSIASEERSACQSLCTPALNSDSVVNSATYHIAPSHRTDTHSVCASVRRMVGEHH